MLVILQLLGTFVGDLFKSQRRLDIEKSLSSASAQYCRAAYTVPSAAAWE
jgi:hypothetical protein